MDDEQEILKEGSQLEKLSKEVGELFKRQAERADRLEAAQRELEELLREAGLSPDIPRTSASERPERLVAPRDLSTGAGSLDDEARRCLDREFSSIPPLPLMDELDRFVVICVGCLAALSDFVLVGLPPSTPWTPKKTEPVPVGLISRLVKRWNVGGDNWLARLCRVPYDRVFLEETSGIDQATPLPPHLHRFLTFGHEPSAFGFLVGMIDIITWSLTGTDAKGRIIRAPIQGPKPSLLSRACLAPLIWLGHLVSDAATKQGIPVPGSSLFRLFRLPLFGASVDEAPLDLARKLYEQGYDLRHYLAGGVSVAGIVEGFIRLYDRLRFMDDERTRHPIGTCIAEGYAADARENARLASRLFWAHAIASGANAGRVALDAAVTHDLFAAARNINLAQWRTFAKRTLEYVGALFRETEVETALEGRRKIEERWKAVFDEGNASRLLYIEPPPNLRFEKMRL